MQTQGAIANLINRYRAVLNKCRLLNAFGSLAVAGMLVMGGVTEAKAARPGGVIDEDKTVTGDFSKGSGNSGGAFFLLENAILTINGGTYSENQAFDDGPKHGGGAIYSYSGSLITINNNAEFIKNYAARNGGAIRASGDLKIDGASFIGNESKKDGGAIYLVSGSTDSTINNVTFKDNKSGGFGGAIANSRPNNALIFSGNNVFENNISFTDINQSSEWNNPQNLSNDIYNGGKIVIESGTTDLRSGYMQGRDEYRDTNNTLPPAELIIKKDAQLAVASIITFDNSSHTGTTAAQSAGTITVNQGGALGNGTDIAGLQAALTNAKASSVDTTQGAYVGKASLDLNKASLAVGENANNSPGTASFAANSALLVDQTALDGAAAFTGVNTANLADTAQVHVQNAVAGQSLTLFDNDTNPDNSSTTAVTVDDTNNDNTDNEIQITSDNRMVEFGTISNGQTATTTAKAADVSKALPGLSGELGVLATNFASVADRSQRGQVFWANALDPNKMSAKDAVTTLESAARVAAVAGVPHMTWAAQKAANAAVTQRTSLAAPASAGLQAVAADGSVQTGASAGDAMKNGFAMWIMPLYQSWNAWGMEGGNLDMDVNGNLGGLAVGADYTFADAFRAGITVNMGGGYAEGSGDFNKTTNEFTFWGLGAYLGWSKDNFGLTADINHTWVYNDVEQDLAASMQMDTLKSDITSRALSAGLRGEYKLATDALDITPHVGVRYTYLTTDNYDVESGNGTVLEGDTIHQGIWTFPIGVAFSKDVQMDSGWYVKPSLDVAVVPAAGDIKARGNINFTGVPGSAELSTQTMDYITYMGQAGLEFGNDNVKLGVNYNLQMGAQSTAHGVFGTLRYEF